MKHTATYILFLLFIPQLIKAEIPDLSLAQWQKKFPLHTKVVIKYTRCENKKHFTYAARCYRKRMIRKYGNDKRRYVYFVNQGKAEGFLSRSGKARRVGRVNNRFQGFSNDACLGINACFGFGLGRNAQKITNIAAWGILPNDPEWIWEAWKEVQYEDAWELWTFVRKWCKRYRGKDRRQCSRGYFKIKDPNAFKFPSRAKFNVEVY